MKRAVIVLGLLLLLNEGCATRVRPGYAGIKINYSGTYRGVEEVPRVTGWVFYMPGFSTVLDYPTFVQTGKWEGDESISFNSKENLVITVALSISYQIGYEHAPAFYLKFRTDDLRQFTDGFFHNVARDIINEVAGHYSVEGIMGPEKEPFLKEVRSRLNSFMADFGVTVVQLGFIGSPVPPKQVMDQLNAKVAATQAAMTAENEVRKAKAMAQSAIAKADGEAQASIARARGEAQAEIERATGRAKANELISRSVTSQVLQWRSLELQGEWIDAWKSGGQIPSVMGSGNGLLLNLTDFQKHGK